MDYLRLSMTHIHLLLADEVRDSIGKLNLAGFIEYVSDRKEAVYGGKQIKHTLRYKVNLSKIRQHLGENGTSKLF